MMLQSIPLQIALLVLFSLSLIGIVISQVRLKRKLKSFMKGKNAESLEESISSIVEIKNIQHGGMQEFGKRPGTPPLELIMKFSHAFKYATSIQEKETTRLKEMQNYFENKLAEKIPGIRITAKESPRLPSITHIALKGIDSELLVIELDARGIAVSSKSACKNESVEESSILNSIYGDDPDLGVIRFSFGRTTTKKNLDDAISALLTVINKYKPNRPA